MISPNGKRRWWFLVMVAVFLLAVFAAQEVAAAQLRSLAFPALSLGIRPDSSNPVRESDGLNWGWGSGDAYLILPRPPDWDGTSDIQIRIFFRNNSTGYGTVQFVVRPRVYDPLDIFQETDIVSSDSVYLYQNHTDQYYQMTISIPASRFGVKSWWYLVFQRNYTIPPIPTYNGTVVILSVAIGYTAISPLSSTFLPSVIKQ